MSLPEYELPEYEETDAYWELMDEPDKLRLFIKTCVCPEKAEHQGIVLEDDAEINYSQIKMSPGDHIVHGVRSIDRGRRRALHSWTMRRQSQE